MKEGRARFWKRIGIGLVCLCVVSYALFHVLSLFSEEIGTVVVGPTTERTTTTVNGYIFRDADFVSSSNKGAVDYAVDDGEKVAVGDSIATVYSEGNSESVRDSLGVIDEYIELLEETTENKPSVSSLTSIRQRASDAYYSLMKQMASGGISTVTADQKKLVIALNSIASITDESFAIRKTLEELYAARGELLLAGGESEEIFAQKSGYFYTDIDGYENSLTGKAARELDADGFLRLFDSVEPDENAFSYVGKMSYNASWYYVAELLPSKTEAFEEGARYTVEFMGGGYFEIDMTLERVLESADGERAVLVFSTNVLPRGFGFERRQSARIVTESISGIYVPMSAVHRERFEKVVYIINGSVVQLRHIDVIYEGADYYIVREEVATEDGDERIFLRSNDQLIVRGSNLFDGRILD